MLRPRRFENILVQCLLRHLQQKDKCKEPQEASRKIQLFRATRLKFYLFQIWSMMSRKDVKLPPFENASFLWSVWGFFGWTIRTFLPRSRDITHHTHNMEGHRQLFAGEPGGSKRFVTIVLIPFSSTKLSLSKKSFFWIPSMMQNCLDQIHENALRWAFQSSTQIQAIIHNETILNFIQRSTCG